MDHQWRPRPPPIPGTICPTCAFSHFPFCPPHPNPPDQQPDHFIPRPAFDVYRPPDGFADPRAWSTNPQFQPFREGFARPPYDHHRTGFVVDGDRNKRMRVDDNGVGDCSEDERRLKLIRDHGGMLSGLESSGFEDRNGFHKDAILNQEFPQSHEGPVPVHSQRGQPHKAPLAGYDYHSALQFQTKDSQFAHYHDQSSGIPMNNPHMGHGFHLNHPRDLRQSSQDGYQGPGGVAHYGSPRGHMDAFRAFNGQPPLPASPPPPLPPAPAPHPPSEFNAYFSPPKPSTLFPVRVSPSPLSYPSRAVDSHAIARPYFNNTPPMHASASFEDSQASRMLPKLSPEKQKVVDASNLFKQPNRATRPDHFVIILRGLPGSGKSYLAKFLRDLEVENGGGVPRIHSMDDYFMTEVEKADESDVSRSSTSARGKKRTMKKVMEYCYEPEMEEAYRSSMFKAFKKTLEEGVFTSVIVDDRNLRVADFAQFWAIAKRSGYEVYVLEATYKDPAGCAARNIHGFTQDDIEKMARQWEEAPSLYLQLDIKSLFHGDDLKETGIQEVDMDMDDGNSDDFPSGVEQRRPEQVHIATIEGNDAPEDLNSSKDRERVYAEGDQPTEDVKELVRSKWSNDLDEDMTEKIKGFKGNTTALSGLIQAYSKEGKSVRWGDQVHSTGFSIGAAKKNAMSLEIGPGAGYNLKSNPLPEDGAGSIHGSGRSRRQNMFQEQLRAEHESFRAVFDRRRQRLHVEEE